jgi:hypothetical protein
VLFFLLHALHTLLLYEISSYHVRSRQLFIHRINTATNLYCHLVLISQFCDFMLISFMYFRILMFLVLQ